MEYISNAQFRADKTRLTRAKNTGNPVAVLSAIEKTLDGWAGMVWPDDWSRWMRAADDARMQYAREVSWETDPDARTVIEDRFAALADRFF